MRVRLTRKTGIAGIALLAVLATVGVGYAAIPDGNTIQGCYGKVGGVLRVIDASKNQKCSNLLEIPINWNQQGPKGDQGLKGDKGDQGIQGIQGPKGDKGDKGDAGIGSLSAWYLDTARNVQIGYPSRGTQTLLSLDLPAGKYALEAAIFGDSADGDVQGFSCVLISPATIFSTPGNGTGRLSVGDNFAANATDWFELGGVTTLASGGTVKVDCNSYNAFWSAKLTALTVQ